MLLHLGGFAYLFILWPKWYENAAGLAERCLKFELMSESARQNDRRKCIPYSSHAMMAVLFGTTEMMQIELFFFNVSQQSLPTLWCSKGHPTDKIWFMLFLIYICVFVYLAYETFLNIFAISLPMQYLCALSMHSRQIFTYYMSSHSVQFLKHLKYIRLVQHQKHFKKQHQQNIKLVWPIIQS